MGGYFFLSACKKVRVELRKEKGFRFAPAAKLPSEMLLGRRLCGMPSLFFDPGAKMRGKNDI